MLTIWWIVVGGESGPNHRPMDMAWARSLRNQAMLAGIDFYFKQQSAHKPETRPFIREVDGSIQTYVELPDHWVRSSSDV
jgi:protein gp37